MNYQQEKTDVVVIGGGLAGLGAAAYLAQAGVKVTLFEKAAERGGRAATHVHEGYDFNIGIHALYCGGAAEQVLKELAIPYTGHMPTDIFNLRDGKLHISPGGVSTLLRTTLLGFADKLELMQFFMTVPKRNPRDDARISVQEWIERNVRRPQVRQLVTALARTFVYSTALEVVSAEVFVTKLQLILKSPVLYIDGGWQTLVAGLRKKAEAAGASIVTGVRVEAIEHENGRANGVRLSDGRVVPAHVVIIAARPQDAVKLIDETAYPALRKVVDTIMPAQIAGLDVALSRLPNPRYPVVQDVERPRFMSAQSVYSRVAPQGGALICSFKQLDPRQTSDPKEDERDLENLLDTVQSGWREVLIKRQFLPRIDAIGMLPTAEGGGYAGRPDPQAAGIQNLYLVGDWIGEGFLSDASLGSARQVAQLLLKGGLAAAKKQPLASFNHV